MLAAICVCATVAARLSAVSAPSVLISDAEAAAVLESVLQEHDTAAAHQAGAVLEAVADSIEMPGDRPLEEQYEIERERNEQRVAAAVRALDEEEEGTRQDAEHDQGLEEEEGVGEEGQDPEMFAAKWLQEEEPREMKTETFPATWLIGAGAAGGIPQ